MSYLRAFVVSSVLFLNLLPIPLKSPVLLSISAFGAAWVGLEFMQRGFRFDRKLLALLLLATLLGLGILLNAPLNDYGQDKAFQILTAGIGSALVMFLLRSNEDVVAFAWTSLVLATAVGVGTFTSEQFSEGRGTAFGGNPIWSTRGLLVGIMCAVWLLIWQDRHRWPIFGAFSVCALGTLRLESRFAVVACATGLVLLLIASRSHRQGKSGGRTAITAISVVAVLGLLLARFGGTRISQALSSPTGQLREDTRFNLWSNAWELFLSSPSGIGVGEFETKNNVLPLGYWSYPHNLYLEALVEMGVLIGGILILLVLYTLVKATLNKHGSSSVALAAGLFGTMSVAVFFSGDMNARVFYAMLIFAWVAMSIPAQAQAQAQAAEVSTIRRVPR